MFRSTHFIFLSFIVSSLWSPSLRGEVAPNVPTHLTLADALSLTLARNRELEAFHWEIRIHEADALQAALRQNPELSVEVEDGLGSGAYDAFDVAQTTVSLSQTIETAGKRLRRLRLAEAGTKLAKQDYVLKRSRILNVVTKAFLDVLERQQEVVFASDLLQMQRELLAAQIDRIEAGRAAESEREMSAPAVALAELNVREAEQQLASAQLALAKFWASESPRFHTAVGSLELPESLPSLSALRAQLTANPILGYHHLLLNQHRAALALERSSRFSDVDVSVGARRFEDTDDHALTFGVSIALPLFNRNQGKIRKAEATLEKAKAEQADMLTNLGNALTGAHQELVSSHAQAHILATEVVPAASNGYDLTRESFRLGKASYLELRQAQTTAIEARQKLFQAQVRYHKANVDLETLTGRIN